MEGYVNDPDWNDPDDIIREIDETNADACQDEIDRLTRKRRGYRAAFTEIINNIGHLINTTRGANGALDRSESNKSALQRARDKLESRYEKLQRLNRRQLTLYDGDDEGDCQKSIDDASDRYNTKITDLSRLMIELQPPNQGANGNDNDQAQHLKPVQALKPSFILSFDNSPTELAAWGLQFRSYFDASRLRHLPASQQQAFLRQGLNPDV